MLDFGACPVIALGPCPGAAPITEELPSRRANLIAKGLVRTERAAPGAKLDCGFLWLECFAGGFYWVSLNGRRLLRGSTLEEAEELQPKFAAAMERAG